jgi:uncharacterized membrane protein
MNRQSGLSFSDSLKYEERRGFYERNKPVAVLMIFIVFLLPILAVFMWGLPGAALGVLLSVAAYFLTPYAVLKMRIALCDR